LRSGIESEGDENQKKTTKHGVRIGSHTGSASRKLIEMVSKSDPIHRANRRAVLAEA
jgi:hypothetical protein